MVRKTSSPSKAKSSSAKPTLNERPIPKGQDQLEYLYEGQWVRCSRYKEGHRVARDLDTALCGRPVAPEYHAWVVLETRKTTLCSQCANKDTVDYTTYPEPSDYDVFLASKAPRLPVTLEERKQVILIEAKIAMLRRAFGAVELR